MNLKFDENMTVDTSLAQDYIQKQKLTPKSFNNVNIYFDGKNYYNDIPLNKISKELLRSNLKDFAIKLKENQNLIAQLEYLLRKIPIVDTLTQLDLIIQQANYGSISKVPFGISDTSIRIMMANDSPLLSLLYIVKSVLTSHRYTRLHYDTVTETICCFITEICHDTGVPVVSTPVLSTTASAHVPIGTVGVISEFSDIDSAVDIFLASSEHVPWKLQRILVQESVYQQFKNALIWKCKLNNQKEGKSLDMTSSDSMEYNNRIFLLDIVDTKKQEPGTVAVEAYRTRKEMKLLLNQYRPHYLSLWANDIAEINEIAYSIPSSIVWVNNFGDFRGPPTISLEALLCPDWYTGKPNTLSELKATWLKLDLETRRNVICNALDKCITADPIKQIYTEIKHHLQNIDSNGSTAYVHVGKNYVCLCITQPSNKLFTKTKDFISVQFFESVLRGNAFGLKEIEKEDVKIVDIFTKDGIPVINLEKYDQATQTSGVIVYCPNDELIQFTQATKVIWTNSGTTFAN